MQTLPSDAGTAAAVKHPEFVPLVSFVRSWCCSALAVRLGSDLRCKSCGTLLFDDRYWSQRLLIEGNDLHPLPSGHAAEDSTIGLK